VVTGAGKTVFAEMCMLEFRAIYPTGKILIVVPTLALLDQWYVSLQTDLGLSEDAIALYSGEDRASGPRMVNLMVINTAREMAPRVASGSKTLLIVDECHRAGSPENSRALAVNQVAALGLSATPKREFDTGFEDLIAPALGDVIFEYTYAEARKDGVVSPFDLTNIRVDLLEKEEAEYQGLSRRIARRFRRVGDFQDEEIIRLLRRRSAVAANAALRAPVAAKIVIENAGAKMIVFHERIRAADQIYSSLQQRGMSATIYHTGIGPVLRRDNLRLFRAGVFDVLVCCRSLDEGIDVPEASVGIIASSTASNRQRIQRLGRILRPAPNKTAARVFTLYATDIEERRLKDESSRLEDTASVRWAKVSIDRRE
jgi:superfamily II DNA or RNA helicase